MVEVGQYYLFQLCGLGGNGIVDVWFGMIEQVGLLVVDGVQIVVVVVVDQLCVFVMGDWYQWQGVWMFMYLCVWVLQYLQVVLLLVVGQWGGGWVCQYFGFMNMLLFVYFIGFGVVVGCRGDFV